MINGIEMKGKRIIIPFQLQKQLLEQLHSNHMSIAKMRLLSCELVYLVNMNTDIENRVLTSYAASTQMDAHYTGKGEDMTQAKLIERVYARTGKSDGRQDSDIGDDAPNWDYEKQSK